MRLPKLSKILLFLAIFYTKPFDLGYHLLGFDRTNEFFGLIFRLADLALLLVLCSLLAAIWKRLKAKSFNLNQGLILSLAGFSLISYWIFSNLASLQSFKSGLLTILSLIVSLSLTYKYNPKWLLVLIPYFCFDHILVSSTVAASVFGLLGFLGKDLSFSRRLQKSELVALGFVLSINLGLAIYQVVSGRSLGLSWLGEPNLSFDSTNGIAKQILPFTGQIMLRGYGLMPHPNILGFLGIFGFLVSSFSLKLVDFTKNKLNLELINIVISLAVITVSMSRMALMALAIWIVLGLFLRYQNTTKVLNLQKNILQSRFYGNIFVVCLPILVLVFLVFSLATRSSSDLYRLKQHQTLITFIQNKPIVVFFGVGPGQYPNQLRVMQITQNSWENEPFYQPFGNLLLELGLVGLVLMMIVTSKIFEIL